MRLGDRRRKKLIESKGTLEYWAHVLWQRHGLRPEEFERMPKRKRGFFIAYELVETEDPCRRGVYLLSGRKGGDR